MTSIQRLAEHPDWPALDELLNELRDDCVGRIERGDSPVDFDPVSVLRTLGVVRSWIGAAITKE